MKTVRIDGQSIDSLQEIHAALAAQLEFPEWYGGNFDALYDCLTDRAEDTEIHLCGLARLEQKLGRGCGVFLRVLWDAAKENGSIHLRVEK